MFVSPCIFADAVDDDDADVEANLWRASGRALRAASIVGIRIPCMHSVHRIYVLFLLDEAIIVMSSCAGWIAGDVAIA